MEEYHANGNQKVGQPPQMQQQPIATPQYPYQQQQFATPNQPFFGQQPYFSNQFQQFQPNQPMMQQPMMGYPPQFPQQYMQQMPIPPQQYMTMQGYQPYPGIQPMPPQYFQQQFYPPQNPYQQPPQMYNQNVQPNMTPQAPQAYQNEQQLQAVPPQSNPEINAHAPVPPSQAETQFIQAYETGQKQNMNVHNENIYNNKPEEQKLIEQHSPQVNNPESFQKEEKSVRTSELRMNINFKKKNPQQKNEEAKVQTKEVMSTELLQESDEEAKERLEQMIANQEELDKYMRNQNFPPTIQIDYSKKEAFDLNSVVYEPFLSLQGISKYKVFSVQPIKDFGEDHLTKLPFETQMKQKGFNYWRAINGDGNCYYRAVMYLYIEEIVLTRNEQALFSLIAHIQDGKSIYNFPPDTVTETMKQTIIQVLANFIKSIRDHATQEFLSKQVLRAFSCQPEFDYGLISILRCMIANFMQEHKEKTINNGMPLKFSTGDNYPEDFNKYIKDIVMKSQRDAEGILLVIAPIVLRINITIVNLQPNGNSFTLNVEEYKAHSEYISIKQEDGLNFHNKTIHVVRFGQGGGHYESLYHDEAATRLEIVQLSDRDEEFKKITQDNRKQVQFSLTQLLLDSNNFQSLFENFKTPYGQFQDPRLNIQDPKALQQISNIPPEFIPKPNPDEEVFQIKTDSKPPPVQFPKPPPKSEDQQLPPMGQQIEEEKKKGNGEWGANLSALIEDDDDDDDEDDDDEDDEKDNDNDEEEEKKRKEMFEEYEPDKHKEMKKLSCGCEEELQDFILRIDPEWEGNFVSDSLNFIPKCLTCHKEMTKEDLIMLVPDFEYTIRTKLFKEKLPKPPSTKEKKEEKKSEPVWKPGSNLKPPGWAGMKLYNEDDEENDPKVQELINQTQVKFICDICENEVESTPELFTFPECGCHFHYICLKGTLDSLAIDWEDLHTGEMGQNRFQEKASCPNQKGCPGVKKRCLNDVELLQIAANAIE